MKYWSLFWLILACLILFVLSCEDDKSLGVSTSDSTITLLADTFDCCLNIDLWEIIIGVEGSHYFWQDSLLYICSGSTDAPWPMESYLKTSISWEFEDGYEYILKMRVDLQGCGRDSDAYIGVLCNNSKKLGLSFPSCYEPNMYKFDDDNYDCTPAYDYEIEATSCSGMHDYFIKFCQDSVTYYLDGELIGTTVRSEGCEEYIESFAIFILATGYSVSQCIGIETVSLEKYIN